MIKKLREWVTRSYNVHRFNWTTERSNGNCYDCFQDGYECGNTVAAYEIGGILEMELEEPKELEE